MSEQPTRVPESTRGGDTTPPGDHGDWTIEMPAQLPELEGFQIIRELGRGAMGVVYEALHLRLDRRVAVKMIAPSVGAEHLVRFRTEAEAIGRLKHPNIVQVYDFGSSAEGPYIVLELVEGRGLDHVASSGPLPPRRAAEIVEQLARAMEEAHSKGVVHRDLKPSNVLIDRDGASKVTDFGLAKKLESDSGNTQAGEIMGTPNYMSPEQASGWNSEVGPSADIYALGAILYDLLTGKPPFVGDSVLQTLDDVRHRDPVPLRAVNPRIHRDLETICLKCLEKDRRLRYGSAGELADELARFLEGEAIQARPVGWSESLIRRLRRRPRETAVAVGIVLLMALGTWFVLSSKWDADQVRAENARQAEEFEVQRVVMVMSPTGLPMVPVPGNNPLTVGKVALGRLLFFDQRLSRDRSVSCASCHDPEQGWANHTALSHGVEGQLGTRNAQTVVNASQFDMLFWDGRASILEEQTLGPLLHPAEMGMTEELLEERLSAIPGYRAQFEQVFDDGITLQNIGMAIAAYERTLVAGDSPYDRFRTGEDPEALSPAARRGLDLFTGKANCSACHTGPNLSDEAFHNIGIGIDEKTAAPRDPGRWAVSKITHPNQTGNLGRFRTPSLRDVDRTPPYMHDGSLETLEDVIEHYDRGGVANGWPGTDLSVPSNNLLDEEIRPLGLTADEKRDLATFLREALASRVYPADSVSVFPKDG